MLDDQALAKGLQISVDIVRPLADHLGGDALRLKQILLNIVGNAIKFSERGHITLRVRVLEHDSHSLLLRFEVADQGIGLSEEQQTQLFRVFSQVDTSSTREYGGSGLGLVISKRLAMLMGGDVGVASQPGVGSTFWVTARLKRASQVPTPELAGTGTPRDLLEQRFAGRRVLVAEDDPTSQEVARNLLEDAGLTFDMVGNGQQAVARARTGGYALILMDLKMPVLDGLEATRAIRRLPGMADIPIVAMTANAFDDDRDRCLAAGMNAHLAKPVEAQAFYATLLKCLSMVDDTADFAATLTR
jgi:CheY-like chemotaxis protein